MPSERWILTNVRRLSTTGKIYYDIIITKITKSSRFYAYSILLYNYYIGI
jgi:hypothetical protein